MKGTMQDFRWSLPNVLSLLRIAAAPVMLCAVCFGWEQLFVWLFIAAQVSDILDGILARALRQQTKAGALLDSYGDVGSYVCGISGIAVFHPEMLTHPYGTMLLVFAVLYLSAMLLAQMRYGRLVAGLHLYSSKLAGYLQGSFLVVLFATGLVTWFFWIMIIAGIVAELEILIINSTHHQPVINAKGIWWMVRENRWKQ